MSSTKQDRNSQPTLTGFHASCRMPDGYYSGDKPNPSLRQFVQQHATPYDPDADNYTVVAHTDPITTTKATAVYNMHTYWSKKPHDAIRQYVRHYTSPGDIVLDPFCGSGGTSLAALVEDRKAIAIDRSPAATFITKNYCTPIDPGALTNALRRIERNIGDEIKWLYETKCDRCGGPATTGYTVYSQVFQCPRCLENIPLFDCVEAEGQTAKGTPKKVKVCPHCHKQGHLEVIRSQSKKFGAVPVMVSYLCEGGCRPARSERRYNDDEPNKRRYFQECDIGKLQEIEDKPLPYPYPQGYDMSGFSRYQRDALFYYNVKEVADLFVKRNLWALAAIRAQVQELDDDRCVDALLFALSAISLNCSRLYQYRPSLKGGFAKGTYYIPQDSQIIDVWRAFHGKVQDIVRGSTCCEETALCISTQSSTELSAIPTNSIDYVFTDPPYADKVQYGELNYVWEAWLDLDTSWHDEEIIVNQVRGKTEEEWCELMRLSMAECFRVLKPGRWLSLCYHDTSEGTWALIQDIMAEVGFVVDKTDSALFIDTGQKSYNQLRADKTTKRDLVLNFRKPKPSDGVLTQVVIPASVDEATFTELGQQVIKEYLTVHPGGTKDRIYDELVSRMVRKQQMEAHDFEGLLRSVAEEVQEPIRENLFENREPDLFGGHVSSRWYLKETADQIDQAEQEKEDAAADRLEAFVQEYLNGSPGEEGVHYSDLFEEYLPVADKPRRLLADWIPEYFYKTSTGKWRPPKDDDERQQKVAVREKGTLRRVKRFANALIDGVPVRDKDRPTSDADLADWIQQCRRAGLYEQGRALYEKGGLNLDKLDEVEQLEVEDAYRICVRRDGEE